MKQAEKLKDLTAISASAFLAAALSVGIPSLATGWAFGKIGSSATHALAKDPKIFLVVILTLILTEAVGLFGLITSIMITLRCN